MTIPGKVRGWFRGMIADTGMNLEIQKEDMSVKCNICGGDAVLKSGDNIYGIKYAKRIFWYCNNGHEAAWVSAHSKTKEALGTLADSQTRKWRLMGHQVFDPLWKTGVLPRTHAYAILSDHMGLTPAECHFSWFTGEQCQIAIKYAKQMRKKYERPTTKN